MEDQITYQDGDIIISKTLARFGGVSYPTVGIGSVRIAAPRRGTLVFFGVVSLIVALSSITSNNPNGGVIFLFLFIGLICLAAAFSKPHTLVLRTASGDVQAHKSKDVEELETIKQAIERAVSLRG